MANLPSAGDIKAIVSLLAPGLIIQGLMDRVRAGGAPELRDRLIGYGVISAAYYAVFTPIFSWCGGGLLNGWLIAFLEYALVPVVIGIALAYVVQGEWDYRLAERFGLQLAHHIPAAWDYKFSLVRRGVFLLVTLNDGTEIAGSYSGGAFASTNKDERDLLLSQLWSVDENGVWTQVTPQRSILLCGGDIRSIEFFEEWA